MSKSNTELAKKIAGFDTEIGSMQSNYKYIVEHPQQDHYELRDHCIKTYETLKDIYNKNFIALPKNERTKIILQVNDIYQGYKNWVLNVMENRAKYTGGAPGQDFINSDQFKFIVAAKDLMGKMQKTYKEVDKIQSEIEQSSVKQRNAPPLPPLPKTPPPSTTTPLRNAPPPPLPPLPPKKPATIATPTNIPTAAVPPVLSAPSQPSSKGVASAPSATALAAGMKALKPVQNTSTAPTPANPGSIAKQAAAKVTARTSPKGAIDSQIQKKTAVAEKTEAQKMQERLVNQRAARAAATSHTASAPPIVMSKEGHATTSPTVTKNIQKIVPPDTTKKPPAHDTPKKKGPQA